MGLLLLFFFRYNFNWYYIYSDINLVVFPSRFLLLAISLTISPCSLLLLHFCAMVYCTLIYQACQVTSFISFQVLIQVTFFLFIAARHSSSLKADWHAIHRAALCTDDNIDAYNFFSSQVFQCWSSFGDVVMSSTCVRSVQTLVHLLIILLVDPVMSNPCVMCTSGTRHMPSSQCGHLLITTFSTMLLYYLEYIFLNWLPYYYILYITFILPWYMSFLFYSPACLSQARRGEGVIQDSYLGLISMTEIWDLRDFRPIDQTQ